MKRPLFVVGASMLFALNVLYRLNIKAAWVTSAVALVAFFVFLVFRRIRRDGTLPAVAFTLAVCSLYFAVFSVNVQKTVLPLVGDGKTVHTVKGEIVSLPYINNGRFYCIIKTDEIDSEKISTKIRLSSDENLYSEPFDRVEGEFTLYALGGSSDEMTDYYRSKGLYLGAYTDSDVISEGRSGFHPMYYVLKLKSAVINAIEENLPNECGGILTGFLLGEKSFIPSRTLNDFSLIGSYHLLAVSGLHVTVWAAFVYSLLKLLYIKRRLRSALSIAFVLFFEALTGFNPPVVRAGTLAIFVFLGNIVKNEADSLNSIGLAVTLMLFVNPFAANSASLWLSSFASVGIILISAEVYNKLDFIKNCSGILRRVKEFIIGSLSVTVAVTVFTLPLTALLFPRFSLVTLFANLVLIQLASVAMIFTGIAALLFLIGLKFISFPFFMVSGVLARLIIAFSTWLAGYDNITVSTDFFPFRITAFCLTAAAVICLVLKTKQVKFPTKPIIIIASAAFVTALALGVIRERTTTRFYLINGNDSVSVAVCEKNTVCLLSGGINYFSSRDICDIMEKEGVRSVDLVFIPDSGNKNLSHLSYIEDEYPIEKLVINENGTALLKNGATVRCESASALYESDSAGLLVDFDSDADKNAADFVVTPEAVYVFGEQAEKTDGILLLEVKRDGRTRVKSSD